MFFDGADGPGPMDGFLEGAARERHVCSCASCSTPVTSSTGAEADLGRAVVRALAEHKPADSSAPITIYINLGSA